MEHSASGEDHHTHTSGEDHHTHTCGDLLLMEHSPVKPALEDVLWIKQRCLMGFLCAFFFFFFGGGGGGGGGGGVIFGSSIGKKWMI